MSQEITITYSGGVSNGAFVDTLPSESLKIDQANIGAEIAVRIVTTADAAIPLGSVTANGILYLKNLDPTNYVEVGPDNAGAIVPLIRLPAYGLGNTKGSIAIFPVSPTAILRWKANTGSCKVLMRLYQL